MPQANGIVRLGDTASYSHAEIAARVRALIGVPAPYGRANGRPLRRRALHEGVAVYSDSSGKVVTAVAAAAIA